MATTRIRLPRVELNAIALLLAGMLAGVILVVGITFFNQPSAPVVVLPEQVSEMPGGRLGGVTSADSANDWLVKQQLAANPPSADRLHVNLVGGDQTLQNNEPAVPTAAVIGGRLGGIASSDTANDATVKTANQRIVGPGEGLNQVP